jgi:hypothetical protein
MTSRKIRGLGSCTESIREKADVITDKRTLSAFWSTINSFASIRLAFLHRREFKGYDAIYHRKSFMRGKDTPRLYIKTGTGETVFKRK